jgi:protein involved in polysaccharide export with SLBB domain
MRNIQLIRNGEIVRTIDLYDFLLKGDKSQDERLQSGDTIFVPIIGPVVGIAGNVMRPAIYEIEDKMTLGEIFDLAGGVTPVGCMQRVQIERIVAHKKRIVEDFDLAEYTRQRDFPELKIVLQDRDLVKIFPILPTTQGIVYLEGHVKRSGGYQFKERMKLLDLVSSFDELLPEPYLDHADIIRLIPPDFHPETISFNLGRLLRGDLSQNIELKEHDRVTIYSRESLREVPQVTIGGEVQRPGKYRLLENMRIKDLIYNAGNLKRSAYLPEAEITRLIKIEKGVESKVININLGEALKENPEHNILLFEDDYLFVRQIPKWYIDKTITINGEVRFPGVYSFSKAERLSSVLERAGGFTEYAYLKGAFFTKESAKRAHEERLKGFIDRLEGDVLRAQARSAEAAISEAEAKGLEQSLTAKRELLRKTRTAQVTGRVVIVLDSLDKFKGSEYDLELEDGDTLTIPPMPWTVAVLGSVYNQTSIVYTKGKTINYYLNKVGGPTPDAEEGEIYVVKADGSVISKTQKGAFGLSWDPEENRWISGGFMSARIEPGDSILVPSKVTRIVWKRELMDWTTILFQIAVSAGVIIAAF